MLKLSRSWTELRSLLDYSYRAGLGEETINNFQVERASAARQFPLPQRSFPDKAHGNAAAWAGLLCQFCPEFPQEGQESSCFATTAFLSAVLKSYAKGIGPDAGQRHVLLTLQKRFEVNRRIFDQYDQDVRRIGEDFCNIDQYCLLASALQVSYLDSGSFSLLNTAIKLMDLVTLSGWSSDRPYLVSLPLHLEKAILDELQN
jgi:hypothetical protein